MDENDFDQILHTDFHPNTVPPPTDIQHDHQQLDHEQEEQVEPTTLNIETPQEERDISREAEDYSFAEALPSPSQIDREPSLPSFGNDDANINGDRELSYEDKKARQRDQNKLAALKSRAKKRDRYALLEGQVEELQDENEKYRARLAKLQAERPGSATHTELESTLPASTSDEAEPKLPEFDHQYFRKVVNNLESLKFTLLSKEMELERSRQGLTDTDTPVESHPELRERLVRNLGNLILVQAESSSITRITENLRLEKVNMAKERDTITREVDARMAVKQINGVGGEGAGGGVDNVEQALLEVRGWIDETIAKWENEPPLNMGEANDQIPA